MSARRSGPSQLLTIEQAAERLSVSVRNIRHQIYPHKIPSVKIGRLGRIDERDLQDFIERGKGAPQSNERPPGRASRPSETMPSMRCESAGWDL